MSYAEQEALVPNLVAKVKALESELATTRARLEAAERVVTAARDHDCAPGDLPNCSICAALSQLEEA